jgi:hypothetical protein
MTSTKVHPGEGLEKEGANKVARPKDRAKEAATRQLFQMITTAVLLAGALTLAGYTLFDYTSALPMNQFQTVANQTEDRNATQVEGRLYESIRSVCGPEHNLDYFTALMLDPAEMMGLAYLVVILLSLRPLVHELCNKAAAKAILLVRERVWPTLHEQAEQNIEECNESANSALTERMDTAVEEGTALTAGENEPSVKLQEQKAEAAEGTADENQNGLNLIFASLQFVLFCVAAHAYISKIPSTKTASWACRSALMAAMPMAKTVSVPLWVVLLDVGRFSHWLLHRHLTPKQQTGIAAGSPPLDRNIFTLVLMLVSAASFAFWLFFSVPELAILAVFPLTTGYNFVVQPFLVMVVLPPRTHRTLQELCSILLQRGFLQISRA